MHKHKFKHIGGGLNLIENKSDDSYMCDCGLKFILYSDQIGHRFMPEIIEEREISGIDKAEQDMILGSQFDNLEIDESERLSNLYGN